MIGTNIERALALLHAGEVVALPTETVYGLAGNALNTRAVSTIFAVKQRPSFDPLIIHTSAVDRIDDYVGVMPDIIRRLAHRFMPGPLTLLLEKKAIIPDLVTAGSPLVAIRIPNHPMPLEVLGRLDFPLAAPSANPFGYISPTTAQHVEQQLGDLIPYILDGGPCTVGLESTIVGFEEGRLTVFRKGGLPVEDIEREVGPVRLREHSSSNPSAPGMLKSHYAPKVPVVLGQMEELVRHHGQERFGIISFRQKIPGLPAEHQLVLSEKGDLQEAARRLFAGMRRLDEQDLDIILAELLPEEGLGRAINDRLRRAAAS